MEAKSEVEETSKLESKPMAAKKVEEDNELPTDILLCLVLHWIRLHLKESSKYNMRKEQ